MMIPPWIGKKTLIGLCLLGIAFIPYFLNLEDASLWDANESFYAETPREMVEGNNFVIPLFNYTFRWQKPPLAYWTVALMYRLFGVSEWSERLPIVIAAVLWAGLAFWAGRHWWDTQTGLLAGLFLTLNFRVFVMSRRAITEIWLAWLLSLALLLVAKVLLDKKGTGTVWIAASWTVLGLAFMTKGPVALALFGGSLLIWFFWKKSWKFPFSLPFLLSSVLFFLVVLPWYIRVIDFYGWEPIKNFFLSDNFGRYLTEDFGPRRGFWYYVPVFLVDFFPWSFLGVMTWLSSGRKDPDGDPRGKSFRDYLGVWFVFGMVFFSLSRNKQEYYILPIYLPASLLIAYAWNRCRPGTVWKKNMIRIVFITFGLVLLLAVPVVRLALPELIQEMQLPPWILYTGSLLSALLLLLLIRFSLQCRWDLCLSLTIVSSWILLLFCSFSILPAWEKNKPVRDLAQVIRMHATTTDWVGYYKVALPSLAFYMKRPIHEIIDEKHFLQVILRSPGRKFFLLRGEDYEKLQVFLEQKKYRVIEKRDLWRWRIQALWELNKDRDSSSIVLISGS